MDRIAVLKNNQVVRFILVAKLFNQLFSKKYATGIAIIFATITNFKYSRDTNRTIEFTVAPKIFLIPISFDLRSVVNKLIANKPRQAVNNPIKVKIAIISPNFFSLS